MLSLKLTPKRATRDFTIIVTDRRTEADAPARAVVLSGSDPTDDLAFTFKPQTLKLAGGEQKTASLQVHGKPGPFTIAATAEGDLASAKGELIRPDYLPWIIGGIVLLVALVGIGFIVLAACPTTLSDTCGFIPDNPISAPFSSPTFTPSSTPTDTPTFTPVPPTATFAPELSLAPTLTSAPTDTPTITPTPKFEGGLLTFKSQQPNGAFSLVVVPPIGEAITLIANKIDLRVLDYSSWDNLFAVDVYDGIAHTLFLVHGDGAMVRDSINDGWDQITDGDFAPDGSFLALEAVSAGQTRFFFYAADGARQRETVLLTPTFTSTVTRTPTITKTPTITRTPTITGTPSITPTPGNTPFPGLPPTATSILPFQHTQAALTQAAQTPAGP